MKRWAAALICGAMIWLLAFPALGAGIAGKPSNGFVSDQSEFLSPSVQEELIRLGEKTQRETEMTVALVIVDFTGTHGIDQYAQEIFSQWALDQGVVLVVCVGDQDLYAAASPGIGSYWSPSQIQSLLDASSQPNWEEGNGDVALAQMYQSLCGQIRELYALYGSMDNPSASETQVSSNGERGWSVVLAYLWEAGKILGIVAILATGFLVKLFVGTGGIRRTGRRASQSPAPSMPRRRKRGR